MTKNFIIIEPDPIVSMDVEGMLISQFPQAQVTTGASLAEIGPVIYNCGPDSTLFVKGALISASDDLRRVVQIAATRRSQIVIIGGPLECDVPAVFIDLPFTTEMLLDAVMHGTSEPDQKAAPTV